jgi:riboflavin kinase/FMN adenylyltransferase
MKIAIGVFDGVHRGHQAVIARAHLVLTISPHPHPGIKLLTSPAEKKDLIGNMAEFNFSRAHARLSPEQFIIWLQKKYAPETLIVGHDFHFGYQRQGNIETLKTLAARYNFEALEIPEYTYGRQPVRSSTIRACLQDGKIRQANKLLGREYQLNGVIVRGKQLGRRLGYPTINLKPDHPQKLIPAAGVYAAEAIAQNKLYPAAVFIGNGVIEAHLPGFSGNLYGQRATLFLKDYLRANQQFDSPDKLSRQIKKDIQQLKSALRA